jgi:hypothetical protein
VQSRSFVPRRRPGGGILGSRPMAVVTDYTLPTRSRAVSLATLSSRRTRGRAFDAMAGARLAHPAGVVIEVLLRRREGHARDPRG